MLVVAQDGSTPFRTVAQALEACGAASAQGETILIRAGTYREKIVVASPRIRLLGEDWHTTTLIFQDSAHLTDARGEPLGTFRTATLRVSASDVTLENLTVANDAGPGRKVEQAVAVYLAGDRCVARHCRFLAHQDTLLAGPDWYNPRDAADHGRRVYIEGCTVQGDLDFIFGSYRTWFEGCEIHCLSRNLPVNVIIAAPNTPEGQPYGFVFHHCRITGNCAPETVYLGRPWRPFGRAAFLHCHLDAGIHPAGWLDWEEPFRSVHAGMCEYGNTGAGSATDRRHPKAAVLTGRECGAYTRQAVLSGDDHWQPWLESTVGEPSRPSDPRAPSRPERR